MYFKAKNNLFDRVPLRCWWHNHSFGYFFGILRYKESVINISNLSPTKTVSNIRRQHQCNPSNEYSIGNLTSIKLVQSILSSLTKISSISHFKYSLLKFWLFDLSQNKSVECVSGCILSVPCWN